MEEEFWIDRIKSHCYVTVSKQLKVKLKLLIDCKFYFLLAIPSLFIVLPIIEDKFFL